MADYSLIFNVLVDRVGIDRCAKLAIESANLSFCVTLGYDVVEVIGKPVETFLGSEIDSDRFYSIIMDDVLTRQSSGELVINLKSKSGQRIEFSLCVSPLFDDQKKVHNVICIGRNIDHTDSVERALMESEQRFRQMADMTGEWLWEQDPNGNYIYSSTAVTTILGYSPTEVAGKHYTELFSEETRQQFVKKSEDPAIRRGSFFNIRNMYRHKDGFVVSTESTGVPIHDHAGTLLKWRGVDRDVTARIRGEEEMRRAQVKLAIAHHEMKIARKIQETLLPSSPLIAPGIHVQGFCLSADQVGGDYFDYFCRDGNKVDVVIADVSGHAVGPALFMVETRSALRSQSQMATDPSETLFMMNRFLYEDLSQSDHFITMFYLQYCPVIGELSYANAGHSPPLLKKAGESTCKQLDADGLILGVKDIVSFEQKQEQLEIGDIVVLYTDGLTEAQDPDGEFFGIERLCRIVTKNADATPQQLIDICIKELKAFRRADLFEDDLTMVVLQVTDGL